MFLFKEKWVRNINNKSSDNEIHKDRGTGQCAASLNRRAGKKNMFILQPVDIFALSSNRSHCELV
jgi:hypothetical protein